MSLLSSAFKCIYESVSWEMSHGTICTNISFFSTTRKNTQKDSFMASGQQADLLLPIIELKDNKERYCFFLK